ncbi:MAG: hypothetical protein WCI61_09785, partial [Chloroflexota bacterium]
PLELGHLLIFQVALLLLAVMAAWLQSVPGTGPRALVAAWLFAWPLLLLGSGLGAGLELLAGGARDTGGAARGRIEAVEEHRSTP